MKQPAALCLMAMALFAAPALAAEPDPGGLIRPDLLASALAAQATADSETGKLVVVDYSLHSSKERLFVVDLETGAVTAFRAAHGRGSDPDHDGFLDSFSSEHGSNASPEGAFRLAEQYQGQHGRSVRLDGLDDANRTARSRAIVIHAAAYAEPEHLARYGMLGRSFGCIVFSAEDLAAFIEDVPEGTVIFVGK